MLDGLLLSDELVALSGGAVEDMQDISYAMPSLQGQR